VVEHQLLEDYDVASKRTDSLFTGREQQWWSYITYYSKLAGAPKASRTAMYSCLSRSSPCMRDFRSAPSNFFATSSITCQPRENHHYATTEGRHGTRICITDLYCHVFTITRCQQFCHSTVIHLQAQPCTRWNHSWACNFVNYGRISILGSNCPADDLWCNAEDCKLQQRALIPASVESIQTLVVPVDGKRGHRRLEKDDSKA